MSGRHDVVRPARPASCRQPAAVAAGDAERVRLVGDQHGVVRGADRRPARQAVPRRRARSRSSRPAPPRGRWVRAGEEPLDGGDVVVRDHVHRCPAEPAGVDHRGVHVGVGDDQGVGVGQRRDRRRGWRGSRSRTPAPVGKPVNAARALLELLVERQGAGDQAGGAGAGAVRLRRRDRAGDHPRVSRTGRGSRCRRGRSPARSGSPARAPGARVRPGAPRAAAGLRLREPVVEAGHRVHLRDRADEAAVIVARSSSVVTYGGIV